MSPSFSLCPIFSSFLMQWLNADTVQFRFFYWTWRRLHSCLWLWKFQIWFFSLIHWWLRSKKLFFHIKISRKLESKEDELGNSFTDFYKQHWDIKIKYKQLVPISSIIWIWAFQFDWQALRETMWLSKWKVEVSSFLIWLVVCEDNFGINILGGFFC